jgi:Fe-S cluster biogenesis protein NfuA
MMQRKKDLSLHKSRDVSPFLERLGRHSPIAALGIASLLLFSCFSYTPLSATTTHNESLGMVWEPAQEISEDQTGTEMQNLPSIAAHGGKVHVVWQQGVGETGIFYRYYDGTSWDNVVRMSSPVGVPTKTDPSVAGDGNIAYAVWYDWRPAPGADIVYRYYDGASWWAEGVVAQNAGQAQGDSTLAVDGNRAYAAWEVMGGNGYDIFYSYYDGSWQPQQLISNDSVSDFQWHPSIAADGGKVHVVWADGGVSAADVCYRFHNGTSWQPAQKITAVDDSVRQDTPSIAVNGDEVHVVWADSADGDPDIYYKLYNGTDWQPAVQISTDSGTEGQGFPEIALEGSRIHVAWLDYEDGDSDIYYRYYNGTDWQPELEISSDIGGENQRNPAIAAENGIVHIVWMDEKGGNMDIFYRRGVVDLTPPDSNVGPPPGYWQTTSTFDIEWAATDNYSLANVSLLFRHSPDNASWSSWEEWTFNNTIEGTSANGVFIFAAPYGDGFYEFYTVANDTAGNVEKPPTSADTIIGLDTSPPIGAIIANSGGAWTNSTSVNLTLNYFDSTSGVCQVRFSNDGIWDTEPWESPAPSKAWILETGDGTKTVYYQVRDNTSWESLTYSDDIILDTIPPTGLIFIEGGAPWTTSTSVNLTLAYSDASSGVSEVRYSNDGLWDTEPWEPPSSTRTWALSAGDGIKTVFYQVKDNVSLMSTTYTDNISLDSTEPGGSVTINNGDVWTDVRSVTLALTYFDNFSGVSEVRYSNDGVWDAEFWESATDTKSWVLLTGEGAKTVYYQIRDIAGVESTFTDDIGLDITAPTGTITINNDNPSTNSTSVTLTLTCSDSASGVDKIRLSNDGVWDIEPWEAPSPIKGWTLPSGFGTRTVYYQIRDNVGRLSTTYWDHIRLDDISMDNIPPTGSITINDGDEWTTSTSVTLRLTYSDDQSGVSQVRYRNDGIWDTEPWVAPSSAKSWTLMSGDGVKTVYYQIQDNAGLLSSTYSDQIELDTAVPVVENAIPGNGSTDVETETNISVIFSERMNTFATENSFSLMDGTKEVQGTASWSGDDQTLVFVPEEALQNDRSYRFVITSEAKDLAGNGLTSDWESFFTVRKAEEKPDGEPTFLEQHWWVILSIIIAIVVLWALWMMTLERKKRREQ